MQIAKSVQKIENFRGKFQFIDRRKNSKYLVIVVAGYKALLWENVFDRLKANMPPDYDVCLCLPGVMPERLSNLAQSNSWSVLHTKKNRLALAQNLAIEQHPDADYIFKLDEDIFVGRGFFDGLISAHDAIAVNGIFDPGAVVPLINVNGSTYWQFLEYISKQEEYFEQFHEKTSKCLNVSAQSCELAAQFLWNCSLPFDRVVDSISEIPLSSRPIPHRFSIGAFLMRRQIWTKIGGFTVSRDGQLGVEERELCAELNDLSCPLMLANNVFCGHFAFGPQTKFMDDYYISELKSKI